MLSALLIMLVRVKLASGSKKGARGGEGGREGLLFVGIDLCGGGAGEPRRAPVPGRGWGEERGAGPRGEGARGDPRPEQPRRRAHAAVPFR